MFGRRALELEGEIELIRGVIDGNEMARNKELDGVHDRLKEATGIGKTPKAKAKKRVH